MARALFLIQHLAGGGTERVVSRVLGALAAEAPPGSYHLALLEPKVSFPVPAGVVVHVLGQARRGRAGAYGGGAAALARLARLLRRERPAAVVSFLLRSNALNLLGRRFVPGWPRAVISERCDIDSREQTPGRGLSRSFVRVTYRWADAAIAVSAGIAEQLVARGVPAGRIAVIPNPVAAGDLKGEASAGAPHAWASGPDPLLVAVGRLEEQKGYPVLLEALARVRRVRPARLVVFGDGPDGGALRDLARRLGLTDAVAFAGFDPNPFPTVARADVFVLPSLWEGFPNALLEAMALGRPVVAADCRFGPRDLLGESEWGLLVPPRHPGALADAILRLLTDDDLRREYAARAGRRAEAFAPSTIAARYLDVIDGRASPLGPSN